MVEHCCFTSLISLSLIRGKNNFGAITGACKGSKCKVRRQNTTPDRGCGDSACRPAGLDLAADAASSNFATKLPHPEMRVKRKTINQSPYQPL